MAEQTEFRGIRYSDKGISERNSNGKPLVWVPKEDVLRTRLIWTTESRSPLLQAVFSFLLMGIGVGAIVLGLQRPGGFSRYVILMMALLPIGLYFLYSGFRRRVILLVVTAGRSHRLVFHRKADLQDMMTFVSEASEQFGYKFANELPTEMLNSSEEQRDSGGVDS
ncbi:MAG: hypothetical protein AAF483_13185 [Planctomycetota bacterium]